MSDIILVEQSIHTYFEEVEPQNNDNWEDLEKKMIEFIHILLDKQPERLLQAAYRLDLPEKSFSKAFYEHNAEKIVELILQKEQQRLFFRKKYASD
ncbi:MAG: hypothetical protein SFU27_11060 [Thermonemataceae bacterium]|nr:hypothetical protein [Thermonemataceae bacterium]